MEHSINNPVTQADSLHSVQQPEVLTGQVNGQAQMVKDIVGEAVNKPTANEQERDERRGVLASMRVASTTEVEPEVSALTVDDVGLFALSDIHGLKGKQKCGKTTALKVCLAAWMKGSQFRVVSGIEEPRVLYMDTEQRRAELQQKRQEAKAEKDKNRLEVCLSIVRNYGGTISRKQLMEEMMKELKLDRSTISKFITSQVEANLLFEVDKNISSSPELTLPL